MIYIYFNFIFSFLFFGSVSILDDYMNCNTLEKNKIQIKSKEELLTIYKKTYKLVFFNVFVSIIPVIYFSSYIINTNVKYLWNISFCKFIFELLCFSYLIDIFFYLFHRLFHTKLLYKYHKIHHQIKKPIGISAFYFHPIDFIFGNIIPIVLSIYISQMSLLTIHITLCIITFDTIFIGHSGNKKLSNFHDNHHKYFCFNFGTNKFMDKLLLTYK